MSINFSFKGHNPDPVHAAITIQSSVRGFLARKNYDLINGKTLLNNYIALAKTDLSKLFSRIIKIADCVENNWSKNLITQNNQKLSLEKLESIRKNLLVVECELNVRGKLLINRDQIDDFVDEIEQKLNGNNEELSEIFMSSGGMSLKRGLEVTLGSDWELSLPSQTVAKLKEFNSIFIPTGCKDILEEDIDMELFPSNKPFFTKVTHFNIYHATDAIQGAELHIPYTDDFENRATLIVKGYFKKNPLNYQDSISSFQTKMNSIKHRFSLIEDIPQIFKINFLNQYPIRDLIVNSVDEIIEDLQADYHLLSDLDSSVMERVFLRFLTASVSTQVRLLGLMLMNNNTNLAMALYTTMMKEKPEYVAALKDNLHFSLQRKLDLELNDFQTTMEQIAKLNKNSIPIETRIATSNMDLKTKAKALEMISSSKSPFGGEGEKAKRYVNTLLEVPFGIYTPELVTKDSTLLQKQEAMHKIKKNLDNAVYGQEKSKEAIMEWSAQRIANGNSKGECIAFEGPPGTGKTTFAREGIAKALGRPFFTITLGGRTDGSYLSGHNYTYVGSKIGRIVEILIEAKCMDPVIYLDEVDKIGERGREIIGILTALTDFSQNKDFQDLYFSGIPFDLSRVLFVFSYNDRNQIDPIFRDRMHIIKVEPLTVEDKIVVTEKHLMPEILNACGFLPGEVSIEDEDLKHLIENYTFEAGARKLKENLFSIVRQLNLKRLLEPQSIQFPYKIDQETICKFREEPKIEFKKIAPKPMVGTVNGLYATNAGLGGLTIVQVFPTPSKKRLELLLTGSQGDVMKESMSVARSVAWNTLPPDVKERIQNTGPEGLHIHCPEGATPKDGPSAGGAITTAIISQLTGIPIRNDVAMTGEIDLMGRITAIGGLSAKLHGAKKAGVRLVLIPRENEKDLKKILKKHPNLICNEFQVKLMDTIYDVLENALVRCPFVRPVEIVDEPESVSENKRGREGPQINLMVAASKSKKYRVDEVE